MYPESARTFEIRKEALLTGVRSTVDGFSNPKSGFRDSAEALRLYRDAVDKLGLISGRELPPGVDETKFLEALDNSLRIIREQLLGDQQQILDQVSDDPQFVRNAIAVALSRDKDAFIADYSPPEEKVSLTKRGGETDATVQSVRSILDSMKQSSSTAGRVPTFITLVESVNALMNRQSWGLDFDRKRQFEGTKTTLAEKYEDKILQGVHAGVDGLYQVLMRGNPQLLARIVQDPSDFASRIGDTLRTKARAREAAERSKTEDV